MSDELLGITAAVVVLLSLVVVGLLVTRAAWRTASTLGVLGAVVFWSGVAARHAVLLAFAISDEAALLRGPTSITTAFIVAVGAALVVWELLTNPRS
jgi:hypothetical protein